MKKLGWYKRNPAKFIAGTVGFAFEVKGSYGIVLDLIYDGMGSCADDAQWIANILGVGMTVRRWNVIRGKLIELGKLTAKDGRLFNAAATRYFGETGQVSAGNTEGNPRKEPGKNRDNRPDKSLENEGRLFKDKDLGQKTGGLTHARARTSSETETETETETDASVGDVIVQVDRIASILDQPRGRYWESDYRRMIQSGLTFLDIAEAARAHNGDRLRSIKALSGLAFKKQRDRMASGIVPSDPTPILSSPVMVPEDEWKSALVKLAHRGIWADTRLGPLPGTPGYVGPKNLEGDFLKGWRAQGSHPVEELDANNYFVPYPADRPDPDRRTRWSSIS